MKATKRNFKATTSARRARRAEVVHIHWSGTPLLWVTEVNQDVNEDVEVEAKMEVKASFTTFTSAPTILDRVEAAWVCFLHKYF